MSDNIGSLAERELLDLVRGEGGRKFVVTISRYNDVWTINMIKVDGPDAGGVRVGHGTSFAAAWQNARAALPLTEEEASF